MQVVEENSKDHNENEEKIANENSKTASISILQFFLNIGQMFAYHRAFSTWIQGSVLKLRAFFERVQASLWQNTPKLRANCVQNMLKTYRRLKDSLVLYDMYGLRITFRDEYGILIIHIL